MSLVGALFFVGIDWAARTHAVCVLDPAGRSVAAFPVEHTGDGFTGLIHRLAKLGDPAGVPVAIERPDGRLVDTLLAAGLLDAHWPGAKEVFADVESPISLAFLTRYPSPAHATALGEKRMAAFMTKHGYSGRRSATELLTRLRTAPAGTTSPVVSEALRDAVAAIVGVLTALNAAIKDLDRSAAAHLHEHPDGEVFTSFPRAGLINAAQIRAELAEHSAYTGPEAIAALAGLVPVTRSSGKHHAVSFRWACNKRLRVALTTFADNSRHASPWAADIYRRARNSGKDHPHAVRILARAWVRVIWRCWIDQQPYDPTRHRGATQLHDQPTAA